jgi:hypothetical protein
VLHAGRSKGGDPRGPSAQSASLSNFCTLIAAIPGAASGETLAPSFVARRSAPTARGVWSNNEGGKMLHALIADAQARLDSARRELRHAAVNFDVSDEELMALRARARSVYDELAQLDRKKLKKGLFSFLKFG